MSDVYTDEEKAALADPAFFKAFRKRLEHHMNVSFSSPCTSLNHSFSPLTTSRM